MLTLSGCGAVESPIFELKNRALSLWEDISEIFPSNDPVVARVGYMTIRASDMKYFFEKMPPAVQAGFLSPEGKQRLLDQLLAQKKQVYLAEMENLENKLPYKKDIARQKDNALMMAHMQYILSSLEPITDIEIRNYYLKHQNEFATTKISSSHIVLRTSSEAKIAQALIRRGRPFAAVAKAMSIDSVSAKNGGRLPPTAVTQMDSAYANAVLPLAKGKISEIIKTSAGYELIRKDAQTTYQLHLTEVQEKVLFDMKSQRYFERNSKLQSALDVQTNKQILDSIKLQ